MSIGKVLALGVLVCALVVVPAGADDAAESDPNDSAGVLDVAAVGHGHATVNGKHKLQHTIETYESWNLSDINSNDSLQIEFQLPGNNRTSPPERLIVINEKNGELKAKIYDTRGDPPRFLANLSLSRPTTDSVVVTFAKKWLRKGLDHYKYRVFAYFEKRGTACHRPEGCSDDAPDARPNGNRNWIRHDL
jgi:hypothetical protein